MSSARPGHYMALALHSVAADFLLRHHCTTIPRLCTALYCTAQYFAAQYCTAQYCTAQYCTAQYCTALYCTALCSVQHCTKLNITLENCLHSRYFGVVFRSNVLYTALVHCPSTLQWCTALVQCRGQLHSTLDWCS